MEYQRLIERTRQLTLMNDLYMAKFFDGQPRCAEAVLRAVLDKPTLKVVRLSVEHELVSIGTRSIWLDVDALDAEGRRYDIEVQRDPARASPQRARFHAALLDGTLSTRERALRNRPNATWCSSRTAQPCATVSPWSTSSACASKRGRLLATVRTSCT